MKKKFSLYTNLYSKQPDKKKTPSKVKQKPKNSFSSKNNNIFNIEEKSNEYKDEKAFNKLLDSYSNFVKKYLKNYAFESETNLKNNKDGITPKNKPVNPNGMLDVIINVKDPNTIFENFLDKIKPDFLEENIICELPDIPELYCRNNKLGKNKNNKEDYIIRKTRLINDNEIIISKDLDIIEPLKEEEQIEFNDDKDVDNIQLGLNIDNDVPQAFVVLNDLEEIIRRQFAVNKIIEFLETKIKEKIYFGFDPVNKKDFVRIYGKKFDKNKKMKVIQYNNYIRILEDTITSELTVKELFNVESMSKEELLPRINEVIKIFKMKRIEENV